MVDFYLMIALICVKTWKVAYVFQLLFPSYHKQELVIMRAHEAMINAKAREAFPELVPQEKIDKRWNLSILSRRSKRHPPSPLTSEPVALPQSRTEDPPKTSILSLKNLHMHGELFVNYLRARHEVFVVQKGWSLPEVDGMEFDQYDTPLARWVIVHDGPNVLAGIRIAPTDTHCGVHTYMLRDAQLGLIPNLPKDALFEAAPVSSEIWEATRLFLSQDVPSSCRLTVQAQLMEGMAAAARSVGAKKVIGIVPAVFKRWLKRIGMEADAVGPVMVIDGDKVQAAIMDMAPGLAARVASITPNVLALSQKSNSELSALTP